MLLLLSEKDIRLIGREEIDKKLEKVGLDDICKVYETKSDQLELKLLVESYIV